MAIFYKGVGVGTFWHSTDLRLSGLTPRQPGASSNLNALMFHVARATTNSPFISLTRSYGVARDYAINASRTRPTGANPSYVYEIDISPTQGVNVMDPVSEVAKLISNPLVSSYQHDGAQTFLLGVVDPVSMSRFLIAPPPQPAGSSGGTIRPPNLSTELEAMVRALRDAEVLINGNLPAACVTNRFSEF